MIDGDEILSNFVPFFTKKNNTHRKIYQTCGKTRQYTKYHDLMCIFGYFSGAYNMEVTIK